MRVMYGTLMRPTIPQKPESSGRSSMTVSSGTAASRVRRSPKSLPGALYRMSFTPAPQVTRSGCWPSSRGICSASTSRISAPETERLSTRQWLPVVRRSCVQGLADVTAARAWRAEALRGRVAEDDPQGVEVGAVPHGALALGQHLVVVRVPVGGKLGAGGTQLGHAVGPAAELAVLEAGDFGVRAAGNDGRRVREDLHRGLPARAPRAGEGVHGTDPCRTGYRRR